jgi:hypothetical protein
MPIAKKGSEINLKEMLFLQELNVGVYGVTLYTDYKVEDVNKVTEIEGKKCYTRKYVRTFNNEPMIFSKQELNFDIIDFENNIYNFSSQFFFVEAVSMFLLAISYSSDVNQYFKLQKPITMLELYSRLKLLKNEFDVDTKEANQLLEVRNQFSHMISPSIIHFCEKYYSIYEDELWNQIAEKYGHAVITLGRKYIELQNKFDFGKDFLNKDYNFCLEETSNE